jgi:hypothetical protein
MQMRFTLQSRTPERPRWVSIDAPGFGVWAGSDEGTARYVYTKRVENLPAPGTYRTVVRFRWLDGEGDVLDRARATSRSCRQPDPRPDLAVVSLTQVGEGSYAVLVRNSGRTASEGTTAALAIDGAPQPPLAVPELASGADALLALQGPACTPGGTMEAEVDPDGAVEERTEDDNVLARSC